MRRRAPMARSFDSETLAKMNAHLVFSVLLVAGSAVGYNVRREGPYNVGYNELGYSGTSNINYQEPSQRLFWGEQGSNQIGGTGLWATLTNKFPILGSMFGRMELSNQYGVPAQQSSVSTHYGAPGYQTQYQVPQVGYQVSQGGYQVPQTGYQVPQGGYQIPQIRYQVPQSGYQIPQSRYQIPQSDYQIPQTRYQVPQSGYQGPQTSYQVPQVGYQGSQGQLYQQGQQFEQRFVPFSRDVGLTDDAVIVTPPFVPVAPQPAPAPIPAPAPQPIPAAPVDQGYHYDKPQYRLELPRK